MNDSLLQQGLDLLLYGMGSVFVFLTLLVAATTLMSALLARLFPAEPESVPASAPVSPAADERLLAIIQQAINQHRRRK